MTLKEHNGFTLIELVLAVFMLTITMAAFYSVFRMQARSLKGQENRLEAQQTARAALDFMVREIRNARYNPSDENDGDSCGDGAAGRPGIVEATDKIIHFSYDWTGDGDCNDTNENIKFTISKKIVDGVIVKINGVDAWDITRQADGNDPEALTDGNAKATNGLTLAYFPQGTDPPALAFPLDDQPKRDAIHRVQITIKIDSKHKAAKFGGDVTAEMTTNVVLRNPA